MDTEESIGHEIGNVMCHHTAVAWLLVAFAAMLPASLSGQNYLDLQWETNYFGNYLELSYRHDWTKIFCWGIGFQEGDLSIDAKSHFSNVIGSKAVPSKLSVDIYTCGLFDLFLQYDRKSVYQVPVFSPLWSGRVILFRQNPRERIG